MSSYLLSALKENAIPPSELEVVKVFFPKPSVNNPHTPPSACGLVWSMRILHLGFGKEYLYYSLLRREECTILSQWPVGQNRYALWPSRPLDCLRADQTAGLWL